MPTIKIIRVQSLLSPKLNSPNFGSIFCNFLGIDAKNRTEKMRFASNFVPGR
jgi:hypothetical protein